MKPQDGLSFPELVKQELTKWVEEPWEPGEREWRSPMWELARVVKGRLPDSDGEQAWQKVNRVVTKKLGGWSKWRILGFYRTEGEDTGSLSPMNLDDIHTEFVNSFDKCKSAPGTNLIDAALQMADRHQPYFEPADDHGYENYPRFLSMCAFLPEVTGLGCFDGFNGFYLAQRYAAAALGTRPNTIGIWIKLAVKYGYLVLVKEYPQGVRKAWEYCRGQELEDWAKRRIRIMQAN
jgi:hypothetical protein